jgi:LysM repeat protein
MNDKFKYHMNSDDENIATKLSQAAEQTNVNAQFAIELEEKLRNTYQPKMSWSVSMFRQISPTLRWVALMIFLALVLSWSIKTLIAAPQPATNATPTVPIPGTETSTPEPINLTSTPVTQEGGYDFRGAKLYLEQPLPDSPNTAQVYLLKKDEAATEEQARALADRFGIQGEMYTTSDYIFNTTDYVISDGRQNLQVYSQRFFTYVADMAKTSILSTNTPNDNAEAIIREFLQARGFDFPFSISLSDFYDAYIVEPLAPDSIPMQYESFTQPVMSVMLDENGDVLRVDATLMDYDTTPLDEYGIISAQEAFDKLLDDNVVTGKMEFVHSPSRMFHDWYRSYPDNQPVVAYAYITKFSAANLGTPPLILMNGVPVIGNINGLEGLEYYTFVKATGQYLVENGIRKFDVESWDRKVQESSFPGTLSRQGNQIILTKNDGSGEQYALIDPPVDLPLGTKATDSLDVYGVRVDGKIFWTFIRFFENNTGGGGGGGGGLGFYKLNLTGPVVPFPSPTLHPDLNQGNNEYVVKEGDTLAAIAEAYGLTPEKIIEANSWLNEGLLMPGKTLVIPNPQAESGAEPIEYTVKEGDTCGVIAANFGVSIRSIIALNQLSAECFIFVGQHLKIPYPTSTPTPPSTGVPNEVAQQNVQDVRGFISIVIHKKADGSESKEYSLWVNQDNMMYSYQLNGSSLNELDAYNALPILVSGTINNNVLFVDSYKIPFPDLKFQILKGTQKTEQLNGQSVTVFTTEDGQSYVEFLVTNNIPNTTSFTGIQGDLIQQEVLIVPDETFGGLPVAHIYQSSMIQENGPEMQVQANQIHTFNDSNDPSMSPNYTPPNLTIDEVELAYYVSNPYYQVNDPNYSQRSPYIQPVWHFHGHYEDGSEFDVLIQALKQEFLLPELAPGLSPG